MSLGPSGHGSHHWMQFQIFGFQPNPCSPCLRLNALTSARGMRQQVINLMEIFPGELVKKAPQGHFGLLWIHGFTHLLNVA